jgi:hypothetical protein
VIWIPPETFLSLVQKIGRCVRNHIDLGEAIIYMTHSSYRQAVAELELLGESSDNEDDGEYNEEDMAEADEDDSGTSGSTSRVVGREEALEQVEDEEDIHPGEASEERPTKRRKVGGRFKKKSRNPVEQQDYIHMLKFLVTTQCRWIPWNAFFNNQNKRRPLFQRPPGGRCCDNCEPDDFLYDTIELDGATPRFSKRGRKSSEELYTAVEQQLKGLRQTLSRELYGEGSQLVTGKALMSDKIIQRLATYARHYASADKVKEHSYWHWAGNYAGRVSDTIQEILVDFPDPQEEAQEARRREQTFKELMMLTRDDFLTRFRELAKECDSTIRALKVSTRSGKERFRCTLFMRRPSKTVS